MIRYLPLAALVIAQPAAAGLFGGKEVSKPVTVVAASQKCAITEQDPAGAGVLAGLATIVASALVKVAIDKTTAELRKVKTVKSKGRHDFYLYQAPSAKNQPGLNHPHCITMITGELKGDYSEPRVVKFGSTDLITQGSTAAEVLNRLVANGVVDQLDKAAKIYSVLEIEVKPAEDGTGIRYQPTYMRVFNQMPGNGSAKKQGLVYNISLTGPGATPDGTVYSMAPLAFGTVNNKFVLRDSGASGDVRGHGEKLKKRQTGWLTVPAMSEASTAKLKQNIADANGGNSAHGKKYMPAAITVEVVQTRKPSQLALLVADALTASKDSLATAAGGLISTDDSFTKSQALLAAKAEVAEKAAAYTAAQNESPGNPDKIEGARLRLEIAKGKLAELED